MAVFLDYHSTTPLDKRVLKAMMPYFTDKFGNPSSPHCYGEEAREAVEIARAQVSDLVDCEPEQIYFTASATEANNLVLKDFGVEYAITSSIEHSSILKTLEYADNIPHKVIGVDGDGWLDWEDLIETAKGKYGVISIMMANNEIGVIQDIKRVVSNKQDMLVHTDAAQAIGKMDVSVRDLDIDFMTISGHKIYGPKGIGALYCKERVPSALIDGGFQSVVSSGTLNVPAIVGLGKACELLKDNQEERLRIKSLRDMLLNMLLEDISDITINGSMESRLDNNLNISIDGVPSEVIIVGMDDVIVSGGSACQSSGRMKASSVLLAIEASNPECAIRFGLGRWTTKKDIKYAVKRITEVVKAVRK